MTGALDPEVALINPELIAEPLVVHAAAFKALTAQHRQALRSKTLYSEVVFNLSGSKHVSEANPKTVNHGILFY